jgi:hypothetical protein
MGGFQLTVTIVPSTRQRKVVDHPGVLKDHHAIAPEERVAPAVGVDAKHLSTDGE